MQNNQIRKVSNILKENIVFFCKDCEQIVEARPFGRKFVYRCVKCGTKNVAFGTEKSIKGFYRLEDDEHTAAPVKDVKKEEVKPIPEEKVDAAEASKNKAV